MYDMCLKMFLYYVPVINSDILGCMQANVGGKSSVAKQL